MALNNHVISSFHVPNEEMCKINCYMKPNCVSYNYGPLNHGFFLCELSDKIHLQTHSNDLEAKSGFTYSPIFKVSIIYYFERDDCNCYSQTPDIFFQNPCLSSPCASHSTCQAGFGDKGYRYVCPRGYYGDDCLTGEKKIQVL